MHFTGERYTPGVEGEIEHEHLHRYLFACSFARARCAGSGIRRRVWQCAARAGGSQCRGRRYRRQSVRFANENYARHNLSFASGSATRIPLTNASVDVVISFETIEHFAERRGFPA